MYELITKEEFDSISRVGYSGIFFEFQKNCTENKLNQKLIEDFLKNINNSFKSDEPIRKFDVCILTLKARLEILIERFNSMTVDKALAPFQKENDIYIHLESNLEIETEVRKRYLKKFKEYYDNFFKNSNLAIYRNPPIFSYQEKFDNMVNYISSSPDSVNADFLISFVKTMPWKAFQTPYHQSFTEFLEKLPLENLKRLYKELFTNKKYMQFLYQDNKIIEFLNFYKKNVTTSFLQCPSDLYAVAETLPILSFLEFIPDSFKDLLLHGFDYTKLKVKLLGASGLENEKSLLLYTAILAGDQADAKLIKDNQSEHSFQDKNVTEKTKYESGLFHSHQQEHLQKTEFATRTQFSLPHFMEFLKCKLALTPADKRSELYFVAYPESFVKLVAELKILPQIEEFKKAFYHAIGKDADVKMEDSDLAHRVVTLENEVAGLKDLLAESRGETQELNARLTTSKNEIQELNARLTALEKLLNLQVEKNENSNRMVI